jgi:hypothetical protein
MSHITDNDVVNNLQGLDDVKNQVGLETAKRNDGTDFEPFILVDFDVTHWTRALFCVPIKRKRGIATLWDGSEVNEKKLDENYLNLKERIEFRRRVFQLTPRVISFPKWDIDGPDIHFFAQNGRSSAKDIIVGPWTLDGRKLVADAKDCALMIAEAAKATGLKTVQIINPYSTNFVTQRGWNVGAGVFFCFWSGVRKASECTDVKFVAVCETNPYPFFECAVEWAPFKEDIAVACPCDPFACIGSTDEEVHFLKDVNIFDSISKVITRGNVRKATLCIRHRNQFWNPKDILQLLKYKTK